MLLVFGRGKVEQVSASGAIGPSAIEAVLSVFIGAEGFVKRLLIESVSAIESWMERLAACATCQPAHGQQKVPAYAALANVPIRERAHHMLKRDNEMPLGSLVVLPSPSPCDISN